MIVSFAERLRRGAAASAFVLFLSVAHAALIQFNVPAQPAGKALIAFSQQAGLEVLFSYDDLQKVQANEVVGSYEPADALNRLLLNTGFAAARSPAGKYVVTAARAGDPPDPQPASAPPAPTVPSAIPTTTVSKTGAKSANEEVIALSPFEVTAQKPGSYDALQSGSLSGFAIDQQKLPSTTQTFTQTFMNDVNAETIEQMLLDYSGVFGYSNGDTSAYTDVAGDRDTSAESVRGFNTSANAGVIRFNGFFGPEGLPTNTAGGSTPSFMVEQVDIVEGPQSLLYGAIGGGGVVDAVAKRADFGETFATVDFQANDLGSKIADVDYNVGAKNLAVRFAATTQQNDTVRQDIGYDVQGYYLQLAAQVGSSTIIRAMHAYYEGNTNYSYNPAIKPFLPTGSPLANDTTEYLAVTNQMPYAAYSSNNINWDNVESFGGGWDSGVNYQYFSSLIVESKLLPWLSLKGNVVDTTQTAWRNATTLTLEPAGVGGNPYASSAIGLGAPNFTRQPGDQRAVQLNFLATNDFFNGNAHSQTLIGGYLNHNQAPGGGNTYTYIEADSNWNPIYNPAIATDYGHTLMTANAVWAPIINGQLTKYNWFPALSPRVTLNGQNYIFVQRIQQNAAYKSALDPYGLVPNGSTPVSAANPLGSYNGSWSPGADVHEHYMNFANYTDWFGGKFSTLAGLSLDRAFTYNSSALPASTTLVPWKTYMGYEIGGIYQVLPVLGAYVTLSTAASPNGTTEDLDGVPLKTPDASNPVPEIGLKYHSPDAHYVATLAWDVATTDKNEGIGVDGSYLNAVNPNGINGRQGGTGANTDVNVDRSATSLEATFTAQVTKDWRMRFNTTYLFNRIKDGVYYGQLYNDQFHVNGAGQVTYANGQVVYVNGAATSATTAVVENSSTSGAVPLTTALMNTASSQYYASPDPTSGSITNSALRAILLTGGGAGSVGAADVAADGAPATGVTGLPLSQIQYAFTSPFANNIVPIYEPNDVGTGYPGWQMNFTNDYTISHGPLKGLGFFGSVTAKYFIRGFYTFAPSTSTVLSSTAQTAVVNETRLLYTFPTHSNVNLGIHYTYKLRRATFTTGLTISDLFNHDIIAILPQASNVSYLQATEPDLPRLFTWRNSISF